jgi:predicted ferric reductase
MFKNIGIITIILLTLIPIIIWSLIIPISFRFINLDIATTSLGQILGLLGIVLFSINLILASRPKFLDRYFWGLNKVYDYHHGIGAIAFSMILFHPLFLVFKYVRFSLKEATYFFISPDFIFGKIALILMIVLIVLTFYIRIKYNHWKISHKFMTIVFGFVLLHTFYISSDVSRNDFLRYYILVIGLIGLLLGFWRAFLSKLINNDFIYKVDKINNLNKDVVAIDMIPEGRSMNFVPGQFIFVSFKSKGISREIHPFSISSVSGNIQILVKSLGDYTSLIKNIKLGDKAVVEGPFGKFSYNNISNKKQIWLAGGIGIAPFLGMARSLKDESYMIDLYYCVKNDEEAVFKEELSSLSLKQNNFRLFLWRSDEKGFINANEIAKESNGLLDKDILMCGPPVFMESLKDQFLKLKVNNKKIHWELFKLL